MSTTKLIKKIKSGSTVAEENFVNPHVSSSVCEHKETTYVNINKAGRYKICIKCRKMLAN